MSRIILYGDIHACLDEFIQLRLDINPQKDDIEITVGDFINKGPHSQKIIEYVQEQNILSIMGNNEAKIITLYHKYQKKGEKFLLAQKPATQNTLLELTPQSISYLESLPYYLKIDRLTVVHGGLINGMKLSPDISKKQKEQLTQLRFFNKENQPIPYDDFENRAYFWSEVYDGKEGFVIFGHHPFEKVKIEKHAIGIDTGCVYGGALTAISFPYHDKKVDLDNYTLHSVKAIRSYFV